jgi:cytochrome c-type protein NapB
MARVAATQRFKALALLAVLCLLALTLAACGGDADGVGDGESYIHEGLVTGRIGINEYSTAAPGSSEILPREYPGAPPLVPHSLEGLSITKDSNDCLTCHLTGLSFGAGHTATMIPDSHYVDPVDGTRTEEIQGQRYGCLLCHLPQSAEAFPLDEAD